MRLTRTFFAQPPRALARALLGQRLVRILPDRTRVAGLIVETEAYLGERDRAAHSFGGRRTPRNEHMYAEAGTAYVYFTYGMHHCFNIVCGRVGQPVAVLLRALEPTEGVDRMLAHTRADARSGELKPHLLCAGPARLCRALAIDLSLNGIDLTTDPRLFLESAVPIPAGGITTAPRIGVGYAKEWADLPYRYLVREHPSVSRPPPRD